MNPKVSKQSSAPNPASAVLILDAAAIERILRRIAHEIIERNPQLAEVALAGIPSRGLELSRRIAGYLREFAGIEVFAGAVDVSMHRDDLHTRRQVWPVQATSLPADLATMTIILIDDVLFSGRTCRAAMDAISSFGRPRCLQFAVLVDRGHRELPIRADFVGKNLPTAAEERVRVRLQAVDGVSDSVWLDRGVR